MTPLMPIGSRPVQRLVTFRSRSEAPLLAAIGEAVRAEQMRAGIRIAGPSRMRLK